MKINLFFESTKINSDKVDLNVLQKLFKLTFGGNNPHLSLEVKQLSEKTFKLITTIFSNPDNFSSRQNNADIIVNGRLKKRTFKNGEEHDVVFKHFYASIIEIIKHEQCYKKNEMEENEIIVFITSQPNEKYWISTFFPPKEDIINNKKFTIPTSIVVFGNILSEVIKIGTEDQKFDEKFFETYILREVYLNLFRSLFIKYNKQYNNAALIDGVGVHHNQMATCMNAFHSDYQYFFVTAANAFCNECRKLISKANNTDKLILRELNRRLNSLNNYTNPVNELVIYFDTKVDEICIRDTEDTSIVIDFNPIQKAIFIVLFSGIPIETYTNKDAQDFMDNLKLNSGYINLCNVYKKKCGKDNLTSIDRLFSKDNANAFAGLKQNISNIKSIIKDLHILDFHKLQIISALDYNTAYKCYKIDLGSLQRINFEF